MVAKATKVRKHKGSSILEFPNDFVLLDIETTGLNPSRDKIIEIGAIKVEDNVVVKTFNKLVKIDFRLDPFITNLTGITDEMLRGGTTLKNVMTEFHEFLGDNIIVGYNVNFDVNFLYDATEEMTDYCLYHNFVDVMKYAKKVHPGLERHRLEDLVNHYGFDTSNNHRAYNDCETTLSVFRELRKAVEANPSIMGTQTKKPTSTNYRSW